MRLDDVMVMHLRHYKDGYPLCWPVGMEGDFDGTYDELDVTCSECISILEESE